MRKPKLFPKRAAQYNDIVIHCPHCHKQIVIFSGFMEKHTCYKCGKQFKDRFWKESNKAYRNMKNLMI